VLFLRVAVCPVEAAQPPDPRGSASPDLLGKAMSPSFIGSSGKHNGDALLYQTDEHRGIEGRRIGS
jgi:hypothetical protein